MVPLPHSNGKLRAEWWTEEVDAVVVATGDFDAAWTPDIPGLEKAQGLFPESIFHSREYRTPDRFRGKVSDAPFFFIATTTIGRQKAGRLIPGL